MGAPKIYLHVQRKLYYMEGQWLFKESETYMYLGGGEVGEKWPRLGSLHALLTHYKAE